MSELLFAGLGIAVFFAFLFGVGIIYFVLDVFFGKSSIKGSIALAAIFSIAIIFIIVKKLNWLRRRFAPKLDPPGERTFWTENRRLTRDRSPWNGPDEYICTVDCSLDELRNALKSAQYRPNHFSTLKYVQSGQEQSWEVLSMATKKFNPFCGECQQHTYAFRGSDDTLHLHHHREYPIVRPFKHQSGSRTHSDVDNVLRNALKEANIAYEDVSDRTYVQTSP